MNDELQVEATGETVGEAKWAALRELEKLQPGLDKAAVRFQVVSEGERGPARRRLFAGARRRHGRRDRRRTVAARPPVDESREAARLRELLERIATEIGGRCRIEITEDDESITAQCSGPTSAS